MAHDQAAFGEPGNLDHPGTGGSRSDRWTVLPADSAVVDHLRRHRPVPRVGLLLVEAPTAQYQPCTALHDLFVREELAPSRAPQTRGREEVSLAPKGLSCRYLSEYLLPSTDRVSVFILLMKPLRFLCMLCYNETQ